MVTESKKICVTGAAGQTGRHILKHLAKQSEQFTICAAIHSVDRSTQERAVKTVCPSCCPCAVDADDLDALTEAFRGIDDLFIVPSSTESKVRHAVNYIRAAKRADVKFVAVLSMSGADKRNYLWADQFWAIEEELKRSGVANWCIVRSAFYMQNLVLYAEQYAHGYVPLPIGEEGKFAPVDVDDVGEAAASILRDCKQHFGKTYTLTGPELVGSQEITKQLTAVLGKEITDLKPLEWRDVSFADAKNILLSAGVPPSEVQGLAEFYRTVRETGKIEQVTQDFKKLTDRDPTSLKDYLQRDKDKLLEKMRESASSGKQSQQPQASSSQHQPQPQTQSSQA